MPRPILKVIANIESGNEHQGGMISPTALSGCARKLKLTRTADYYAEPRHCYYAVRGALLHGFLEVDIEDVVTEQRVYKTVTQGEYAPWTISGRLDYYDKKKKLILDFKTMSDKGTYVLFNQGIKREHVWQLNIYRWLLHGGHLGAPDGPQIFWHVKQMEISHLFMNRVITSGQKIVETTVQSTPPNFGKLYKLEVPGTRKQLPHVRSKKWTFEVNIPSVPIYDFKKVEKFIALNAPDRIKGFAEPGHMPDGVMNDYERSWECGFCPVVNECRDYEKAIAVVNSMKDDGLSGFIL